MLVVCQAVCPVADQEASQVRVAQALVLLTMMDQLLRRSTKLFPTNLFSWFLAFTASSFYGVQRGLISYFFVGRLALRFCVSFSATERHWEKAGVHHLL